MSLFTRPAADRMSGSSADTLVEKAEKEKRGNRQKEEAEETGRPDSKQPDRQGDCRGSQRQSNQTEYHPAEIMEKNPVPLRECPYRAVHSSNHRIAVSILSR